MSRIIKCVNQDGLEIRFGYNYAPWLLTDCEGIYESESNVYTSDNTMIDGSTYQGATLKMRNIILTMLDKTNHKYNRQILYDVFKPKAPGIFSYSEGGETRNINYYVESVQISSMGRARVATVSLLCPDPYFTGDTDTLVVIAGTVGRFEFPHCFEPPGEAFSEKSKEKLKTIMNENASDNIGMKIRIDVNGPVKNPNIIRVENQKMMKIGTIAHEMNMKYGDAIEIFTETNNKHIYLISDGIRREINEYMDEESEFIQLMRGKNTIGYDAESGSEYMSVTCTFRYKFLGV